MATDEMVTVPDAAETDTGGRPGLLGSWWAIALTAVALGLSLAWRFLADPSLSAPTRDPAWYTWRAQVILDANPNRVVQDWGPNGLFAAGYREADAHYTGSDNPANYSDHRAVRARIHY